MTEDPRGGRRKSPALATFLSFLWPGLGQWYAGAVRNAVLFALPVLLVVLVVVIQVRDGVPAFALSLLNPTTALTFLALIGLMALWRLISMADAMLSTGRGRAWRRPGTLAVFGGLALVVVLAHSAVASFAWSAYNAGSLMFVTADPGPDQSPLPTVSLPPGETA
ncbi:MAG: hypothetical protein OEV61_06100, partial [Chloroflexota bacterium]|nr:hypothetical protein [Chloroflexota bacterium]